MSSNACEPFDFNNIEGVSQGSVFLMTDQCLNSKFQYNVQLSIIVITLVAFFINSMVFVHSTFFGPTKRFTWGSPQKTLLLSLLCTLSLVLHPFGNFANVKGIPRVIVYGACISLFFISVTFVLKNWFVVKANSTLAVRQERFIHKIELAFVEFNVIFHFIIWSLCITAGVYHQKGSYNQYNLFMGLCLLWIGVGANLVGVCIIWLGIKLSQVIKEYLIEGESDLVKALVRKILAYSYFQSLMWLLGGNGTMGLGVWIVFSYTRNYPIHNFFYIAYFWLVPSMLFTNFMITYSAAPFKWRFGRGQLHHSTDKKRSDSKTKSNDLTSDRVEEIVQEMKKV